MELQAALRHRASRWTPATAREIFDRANEQAEAGRLHGAGPARAVEGGRRLHHRRPGRLARAARAARGPQGTRHRRSTRPGGRTRRSRSRTSRPGPPGSASSRRRRRSRSATWDALLEALEKRHAFFHERGCRASDHGLERIDAEPCTDAEAQALFARLRGGPRARRRARRCAFRSALLHRLALLDHARGWVQQFHLGALRNNNTRMRRAARPRHRLRLDRRLRAGPLARALPRPPRRERPAGEDDPLQPEPARQRAVGDDDRQLPGRHACPARCSSAPPGGSSTSWTAWRRRCARSPTWACSRASSA